MLENLNPKEVFHWFERICAIPRGSGNTRAVSRWCAEAGRSLGLETLTDAVGNVLIRKQGTPGFEEAPPVLLQSHLDMVCAVEPDCARDLTREGVALRTDGKEVWAEGTSLGADNGIGAAMTLALLSSKDIPHPPLEAVFTIDEETGMIGAMNLDMSWFRAKRMVNLDGEEDNSLWVGCAGGNTTMVSIPFAAEKTSGSLFRLTVSGLAGGHSGIDIDKGRANAALLLGRALQLLRDRWDIRLISLHCPGAVNAIPAKASACFAADIDPEDLSAETARICELFRVEYHTPEPGLCLTAETLERDVEKDAMDQDSAARVLCQLLCAPNGVQEISVDVPGIPQTSLNVGQVLTEGDRVTFGYCVRSSFGSQTDMISRRLESLASCLGGSARRLAAHPAWEYRADSPLRETAKEVCRSVFGKEPQIQITHGGMECGVFAGGIPGLDCVSVGPDIQDVHTTRERLSVASTERTWNFLCELLRRLSA